MKFLLVCSLSTLLIASLLSLVPNHQEAVDSRIECDGYREMERLKKCGEDGYLIHYGLANCENFARNAETGVFDGVGKEFVRCTTECLVKKLFEIQEISPSISCSSFEEEAFNTHVPCYLQCDFCEVCRSQKRALFATYRIKDFLNTNSVSQVYQIVKKCGLFSCFT